jgi:putative oxidoreductase
MEFWKSLTDALYQWEWIGVLLARVSVGLLFALSGGGKLFITARRDEMRITIREAGLPVPDLSAVVLSAVEFVFGVLLVVGFLTPLSCLMLIGVMIGALTTTVLPGLKAKSVIGWLGEFLYLPEVLYVVILVWLFFSGPGWLSVDQLILSASTWSRRV